MRTAVLDLKHLGGSTSRTLSPRHYVFQLSKYYDS
jgi:hypothetical protein